MGNGTYSGETYSTAKTTRSLTGQGDFAYSKSKPQKVHPTLDPLRINGKPGGKIESRDNSDHPNSLALIIAIDVTGSNVDRARVAQGKLNELMDSLLAANPDFQAAFWSNDDAAVASTMQLGAAVQLSEFESDNRIDDHLLNNILVGNGGGNKQESYDLILYAAAYKTSLDCVEKRGQKGYLFLYADEPIPTTCKFKEINAVFGDELTKDIPIDVLIADARKLYNVYVMWPSGSSFINARDQQRALFGKDFCIELESPDDIVQAIITRVKLDKEKEEEILAGATLAGVSA